MEVSAWLKNLGLDQYNQAFIDNAIDADTLPRLTSEDLKDLASRPSVTSGNCSMRSPR